MPQEEYEAARIELLEEVARGTSIEDLRVKLMNKNDKHKTEKLSVSETECKIPDKLVQIQAYIRWEKAGKPNYSPEQQLVNFLIYFWLISFHDAFHLSASAGANGH